MWGESSSTSSHKTEWMAQTIFGRWRSKHVFVFSYFNLISPSFFLFQVTALFSSLCSVGHKPSMQTKEMNQKIKTKRDAEMQVHTLKERGNSISFCGFILYCWSKAPSRNRLLRFIRHLDHSQFDMVSNDLLPTSNNRTPHNLQLIPSCSRVEYSKRWFIWSCNSLQYTNKKHKTIPYLNFLLRIQ